MNNLLKLLKLSQKSGDRFIIYNPESPDDSWVAISIKEYEKLVGDRVQDEENIEEKREKEWLTREESDDKINLDKKEEIEDNLTGDKEDDKIEEEYDLKEVDVSINRPVYSDSNNDLSSIKDVLEEKRSGWKIPSEIKNSASEVVSE